MEKIKIGVLGCAGIAERSVIPAILNLPDTYSLVAVGSRSMEKAKHFSEKFGCEACGSYESLVSRKDINALYIPLPAGLHEEWINKALNSGKHVYAEKSMASNLSQTIRMVENARKNKLALMEGFMFQYHAQHKHLKQLLKEGLIGEIRHFYSSFGFPPLDADNFRYDSTMGGGALYDAAAYPLRAAFFILGDHLNVSGASVYRDKKTKTSIYGSAYLKGEKGIGASISFGFDNFYQCHYQLLGSKGKITVEKAFTPRPEQVPTFLLENQNGMKIINSFADNHFEKAFLEFYNIIINTGSREKHFKEILQQSDALYRIDVLSIQ